MRQNSYPRSVPYALTYWIKAGKSPDVLKRVRPGPDIWGFRGPNSEISRIRASGKTEPFHAGYGLNEKVTYIGLPKRFIAGAVVFGDTDACAEGVQVTLEGEGEKKTVQTDNYGTLSLRV